MLKSKEFWKAVSVRAIKTMAQTATAMIGTNAFVHEVEWYYVASSVAISGILSVLNNIGGVPEVKNNENKN